MSRNIKSILLNIVLLLLIFQTYLQIEIPMFQYFDESLMMLFLISLLLFIYKTKFNFHIKKYNFQMTLSILLIVLIGLISNLNTGLQSYKYIFGDIIIFLKFFMLYFSTTQLFNEALINKNILKCIIIFLFIGTIYDYVFEVNLTSYVRFTLRSNYFLYGTPLGLVSVSCFILCLYHFCQKSIDIYVCMILLVIFSTLRFKAIIFLIGYCLLYYFIVLKNKKITVNKFLILGLCAFVVAYHEIEFYFVSMIDSTARGQLLTKSLIIMKDYLPLGTGFGTFGSYMSGLNYSSLYYQYGLNNIYGMSKDFMSYLTDSFWPMIFAQFGFFGTLFFLNYLKNLYRKIQSYFNISINCYFSKILALIYLLLSSITESSFVNPACIGFAIVLGMVKKNE